MPETLYKEFRSVAKHTKILKKEGFKVTEGICNIRTAVIGEYGDQGPIIAIIRFLFAPIASILLIVISTILLIVPRHPA